MQNQTNGVLLLSVKTDTLALLDIYVTYVLYSRIPQIQLLIVLLHLLTLPPNFT